jgi:uncharacterized protein (DUF2164 family)
MSTGVERLDPYGDRSEPAWAGRKGRAERLPSIAISGMVPTPARPTNKEGEMALQLSDERRERLIQSLEGFYLEEFDETLSPFRAGQLLDHVLESVAPHVYNQAVQDARAYMQRKLDELDGEVAAPWV